MDYPTITPVYASVGVECNEEEFKSKVDLSILQNAYIRLRSSKMRQGVFCIKKRIDLVKPKGIQPTVIKDRSNLDRFIKECTVSNFNNKYNCLLYQKNKSLLNKTNYNAHSRNTKQLKSIACNQAINRTLIERPLVDSNNNNSTVSGVKDESFFTKVKEMSSKRRKISINCIKKTSQWKEELFS